MTRTERTHFRTAVGTKLSFTSLWNRPPHQEPFLQKQLPQTKRLLCKCNQLKLFLKEPTCSLNSEVTCPVNLLSNEHLLHIYHRLQQHSRETMAGHREVLRSHAEGGMNTLTGRNKRGLDDGSAAKSTCCSCKELSTHTVVHNHP